MRHLARIQKVFRSIIHADFTTIHRLNHALLTHTHDNTPTFKRNYQFDMEEIVERRGSAEKIDDRFKQD